MQVTPTSYASRDEVDAHAHQQAAARSRLRIVQPGIHRAVSAAASPVRRARCGTKRRFSNSRVYNVVDTVEQPPGQRVAQSRGSLLDPPHLHGRGVVHRRRAQLPRRRDLVDRRLEAADDVDRRRAADQLQRRPAAVGHAAPAVGSQQRHRSRPRPLHSGPLVAGPRHAEPRPALRPVHRRNARELGAAEPLTARARRSASARTARSIPATSAPAWCRTGRTSRRASASRWTCSATAARRSRRATRVTSRARRLRSPTR